MRSIAPLVAGLLAAFLPYAAVAQPDETAETREMLGRMGGRASLMVLHAVRRADGSWRVNGEYLLLPSLQQRFLEGERSARIGVTTLKEGTSPILWGRPATGALQGSWRDGRFVGARFAPGGQERERFEYSERFPSLDGYSAQVRCETGDARSAVTLAYGFDAGRPSQPFEWRMRAQPSGQSCQLPADRLEPVAIEGGLRLAAGRCSVTLRDLGEFVRVTAEDCVEFCGSQAYLEPVLVTKRGGACQLMRPQPR